MKKESIAGVSEVLAAYVLFNCPSYKGLKHGGKASTTEEDPVWRPDSAFPTVTYAWHP